MTFVGWSDGAAAAARSLDNLRGPTVEIGFVVSNRVEVTAGAARSGVVSFVSNAGSVTIKIGVAAFVPATRAVSTAAGLTAEKITYTAETDDGRVVTFLRRLTRNGASPLRRIAGAMTDDDVDSSGGRSPLREFLATESAGAAFIAVAAVIALVWANSPWRESYESLWSTRLSVSLGGHSIDLDLRHWVNDGLMTIFFLLVGLEINRELTDGHFATPRRALAPVAAALGGMALPALVYLAIAGATAPRAGRSPCPPTSPSPSACSPRSTTRAGAGAGAGARPRGRRRHRGDRRHRHRVLHRVAVGWLFTAAGLILVALVLRRVVPLSTVPFVVIGVALWIALYESGVHPTLAGVAMGLLAPPCRDGAPTSSTPRSCSISPTSTTPGRRRTSPAAPCPPLRGWSTSSTRSAASSSCQCSPWPTPASSSASRSSRTR